MKHPVLKGSLVGLYPLSTVPGDQTNLNLYMVFVGFSSLGTKNSMLFFCIVSVMIFLLLILVTVLSLNLFYSLTSRLLYFKKKKKLI